MPRPKRNKIAGFFRRVRRKALQYVLNPAVEIMQRVSAPGSRSGRAFIVFGNESAGTRMLTRFLINCGCSGDPGHLQSLDWWLPRRGDRLVVWRRSIPHGGIMRPNLDSMRAHFDRLGYAVTLVEIQRPRESSIESQLRRKMVASRERAITNIGVAEELANSMRMAHPDSFIAVEYQKFVGDKNYREALAERLGLEYSEAEEYNQLTTLERRRRGLPGENPL